MRHVVMYSGGVASWAAAMRVVKEHGPADVVLLFADTMMEDPDLYRFLDESVALVGVPLIRIADGRTPWEVFRDVRFLGNSRADPCSRILKRDLMAKWLADNCDPAHTVCHVGLDWTEGHRYERLRTRQAAAGWRYEAPLLDPPYLNKRDMLAALRALGVEPPRLYAMGFAHNNCGGFCVKAGQAHFRNLLRRLPEVYSYHEAKEQEMRALLGDVAVLRDRRVATEGRPLTLAEFRSWVEADAAQIDAFEWGGCGCAIDDLEVS